MQKNYTFKKTQFDKLPQIIIRRPKENTFSESWNVFMYSSFSVHQYDGWYLLHKHTLW